MRLIFTMAILAALSAPVLGLSFRQNESTAARRDIFVEMVDSIDLYTPKTGLTVAVQIVKAGGSVYDSIAGSAVEIGNGTYKISLADTDLDTIGQAMLKVSAAGAVMQKIPIEVIPPLYDSNLAAIDGQPTAYPAATLNLARLVVQYDGGDGPAVDVASQNTGAMSLTAHQSTALSIRNSGAMGSAPGMTVRGGAGGAGAEFYGSTGEYDGSPGIMLYGAGTGAGLNAQGGMTNGQGIYAHGRGTGAAIEGSIKGDVTGRILGNVYSAIVSAGVWALNSTGGTLTGSSGSGGLDPAVWTDARASKLDNLDALITSRAPAATALDSTTWTPARAGKLDSLDATITSRAAASTALSNAIYTDGRAAKLDSLDATITSRAPAGSALSNVNWTDARAASLDRLDAAISSRLSAASYLSPPTAGENADAVWDELLSDHAIAGSAAEKLSTGTGGDATAANQQAILDRLGAFTGTGDNTVFGFLKALASAAAGTPSDFGGTFDAAVDSLQAIRDVLRGQNISVVSEVASNGSVTIVQGDDYTGAAAIVLTRSWMGLDLTGASATFAAMPTSDYEMGGRTATLGPLPCQLSYSGGTVTVTIALTSAQTAALLSSPPRRSFQYEYEVEATTAGGQKQTLFLGVMNVRQQVAK